jgi:hypothetical protein
MKSGKISFGLSAVVAGQKSTVVNAAPQLVVNSTEGRFSVTAAVSRKLGVKAGDSIMFLNNIDRVREAVESKSEEIVALCEEQGLDINDSAVQEQLIKEFSQWYISKGVQEFKSNGEPKKTTLRFTEEAKKALIKENAEALLEANRDALIEAVGNPNATDEELIAAITPEMVASPEVDKFSGSRLTSTAGLSGVGVTLNFSDSNVWNQLKADLDEKKKYARVFDVDVDSPVTVDDYFDGVKDVTIVAYPINFAEDKDASRGEK